MQTTNLAQEGQGRAYAILIGALILFASIARGGHDLWSATLVYTATLILAVCYLFSLSMRNSNGVRFPLFLPVLALIASLTVSYLLSANRSEAFLQLLDWASAVLIFWMASNVGSTPSNRLIITLFAATAVGVQAGICLWQAIATNYEEKIGSLVNANILAVFVLPWLILAAERIFFGAKKSASWFACCAGVLAGLICLVLAESGAAWVGLLSSVGIWLLLSLEKNLSRRSQRILWGVAIAGGLIVLGIVWNKFHQVYDPALYPLRNSSNRLFWWRAAVDMWKSNPWFGVGPGNFASAYLTYKVGGIENTLYAHSFVLSLLAESGVVTCVAFTGLIVTWAWRLKNAGRLRSERVYVAAIGGLLATVAISIGLEYLCNLMTLMLLLGLASSTLPAKSIRPRLSISLVAAVLAFCAWPFISAPFFASRLVVDGQFALLQGNLDRASQRFDDAIKIYADDWQPYEGLAEVARRQGNSAAAALWLQQSIQRNRLSLPLKKELESSQRLGR